MLRRANLLLFLIAIAANEMISVSAIENVRVVRSRITRYVRKSPSTDKTLKLILLATVSEC
ncbi:hypothetical protein DL93DRAFT_2087895 [Clavulina sp. PMI_390]|nr:hypothetical protein DL93DRAFT_2087895 [Clavulina sp. PMI_390]